MKHTPMHVQLRITVDAAGQSPQQVLAQATQHPWGWPAELGGAPQGQVELLTRVGLRAASPRHAGRVAAQVMTTLYTQHLGLPSARVEVTDARAANA